MYRLFRFGYFKILLQVEAVIDVDESLRPPAPAKLFQLHSLQVSLYYQSVYGRCCCWKCIERNGTLLRESPVPSPLQKLSYCTCATVQILSKIPAHMSWKSDFTVRSSSNPPEISALPSHYISNVIKGWTIPNKKVPNINGWGSKGSIQK